MKFGLKWKTTLTLGTLVLISMALMIFVSIQRGLQSQTEGSLKLISSNMSRHAIRVEKRVAELNKELHILASMPPLRGIMRALDTGGIDPKSGDSFEI